MEEDLLKEIDVVSGSSKFNYKQYEGEDVTIIDFKHGHSFSHLNSINILRSMYFDRKFAEKLKNEGYK